MALVLFSEDSFTAIHKIIDKCLPLANRVRFYFAIAISPNTGVLFVT